MALTPDSYKAIISGWSWAGYDTYNTPMVVTYSFPKTQPSWHDEQGYGDDKFTALSADQQAVMKLALSKWEAVCGIKFVEAQGDHGDITFSSYDFSSMGNGSSAQAFAFYPYNSEWEQTGAVGDVLDISGDVFFRDDLDPSKLLSTAMHEVGHAIGLKHSFDTENNHEERLDYSDDFWANTVMSYDGEYTDKLGKLDLIAAKTLYGEHGDTGAHSMKWSAQTEILKQTGDDDAEAIRGINLRDVVNGKGGNDQIITFAGDDIINGGLGKNKIWTGEGDDIVRVGRGGHKDTIFDFDEDLDAIQFQKIKGIDSVNDLSFTQKGDNLVIKWMDAAHNKASIMLNDMQENWLGDDNFLFA